MARIPRILITGDPTVYHIISRTALQGFPPGRHLKQKEHGDRQL